MVQIRLPFGLINRPNIQGPVDAVVGARRNPEVKAIWIGCWISVPCTGIVSEADRNHMAIHQHQLRTHLCKGGACFRTEVFADHGKVDIPANHDAHGGTAHSDRSANLAQQRFQLKQLDNSVRFFLDTCLIGQQIIHHGISLRHARA